MLVVVPCSSTAGSAMAVVVVVLAYSAVRKHQDAYAKVVPLGI